MGEVDGSLPIPKAADAIEERGVLRPQHREDAAVGVVDRKHEPERISATVAAEGIGDAAHAGEGLATKNPPGCSLCVDATIVSCS